jgi:uncharacterized membrane protein
MNAMQTTGGLLAILGVLAAFVTTVFWLVIGWRAMRAHEKIAETLREWRSQ